MLICGLKGQYGGTGVGLVMWFDGSHVPKPDHKVFCNLYEYE